LLEKASAQNAAAFSQFQQALLLRTNNPSAFGGGNLKPETALTQTSGHTLSGNSPSSLTCCTASPGNPRLPCLAPQQFRERAVLPDLLYSISGNSPSSLTCCTASPGTRRLP